MALDPDLLRAYAQSFYGYGNYQGKWWLVGLEEGGGETVDDLDWRIKTWASRGRRELDDVSVFDSSPAHGKWFTARPPLQPTWRKLIRMMLVADGRPTDDDSIRVFQGAKLGRLGADNCLLELLPLPSRSVGEWIYGEITGLPELKTRDAYRERFEPRRIAHIRSRIAEHAPCVVVFYSRDRRVLWGQIAGASFKPSGLADLDIVVTPKTIYALTTHPTRRGVTNAYFEEAGRVLGRLMVR